MASANIEVLSALGVKPALCSTMILATPEDQLRFEEMLCHGVKKRMAGLQPGKISLYQDLKPQVDLRLEFNIELQDQERPLITCIDSELHWSIISNQRLIWREALQINALYWHEISQIADGSAKLDLQKTRVFQFSKDYDGDVLQFVDCKNVTYALRFESGEVLKAVFHALMTLVLNSYRLQKASKDRDAYIAHKNSSRHKDEIQQSNECGCFSCLAVFVPGKILSWIDSENTALCPECGIDAVIGTAAGYPITKQFLQRMREFWF